MSYNDTTNTLTSRIIFGNNKEPQKEFFYRDLSKPVTSLSEDIYNFLRESFPEMMKTPHGASQSLLPYFPGYKYEAGVSTYKDFNPDNPDPQYRSVGEGGLVYAEPGMYEMVALLDVASMHPHSLMSECHFGPRYTKAFMDIVQARVAIKHKDWARAKTLMMVSWLDT